MKRARPGTSPAVYYDATVDVVLLIDVDAILVRLAAVALGNKSGTCRYLEGDIKLEAREK